MRLAFAFAHFPCSIPRYLCEALRDLGHSVTTIGPAFGASIPWTTEGARQEGMLLPERYAMAPDIELDPDAMYDWGYLEELLPSPVDAVLMHSTPIPSPRSCNIIGKPSVPYACLASDGHVLNRWYDHVAEDFDYIFAMHPFVARPDQYLLPYCYSERWHYQATAHVVRDLDVVCIGLQYPQRKFVMEELKLRGHKTVSQVGLFGDEYRAIYNRARVAFSWSSANDTIARVFEAPRMGAALVTNQTPDLRLFYNLGEVSAFDASTGVDAALDAVERLLADDNLCANVAATGYQRAAPHTYTDRARRLVAVLEHGTSARQHNADLHAWLEAKRN